MNRQTQKKLTLVTILLLGCFLTLYSQTDKGPLVNVPSKIKDLGTTIINPGETKDVVEITPRAVNAGVFTVPSGKVLIITTVMIFPQSPGSGTLQVRLIQNGSARHYWVVPNSVPTQIVYPTGLVIAPGYSLKIENYSTSSGSIRTKINGYISKDR